MSNEGINTEELTRKRTPSELLNWVNWKRERIASTAEGERTLILHKGLAKQFKEEVYPLALFGWRKYGNSDKTLMQPTIGKGYDAVVTDVGAKPASESYIEITQSHEGENDYLRRLVLGHHGSVFGHSRAIKKGIRKNRRVSIPPQVVSPTEVARDELKRIVDAARRKEAKDYPPNTSLIIVFEDDWFFRQVVDDTRLDNFVKENALKLDLRFSTIYLIGWHSVFREFDLARRT